MKLMERIYDLLVAHGGRRYVPSLRVALAESGKVPTLKAFNKAVDGLIELRFISVERVDGIGRVAKVVQ